MAKKNKKTKAKLNERHPAEQLEYFRAHLDKTLLPYGAKADLAELTGRHAVYLGRLAKGEQQPSLLVALQIAHALKKPLAEML